MLLLLAWFSIYLLLIGSAVKKSRANSGAMGLIPGLGRSPGEGNGNPLQCSYLGNPMDRGVWLAKVHEVAKESDTTLTTW